MREYAATKGSVWTC